MFVINLNIVFYEDLIEFEGIGQYRVIVIFKVWEEKGFIIEDDLC